MGNAIQEEAGDLWLAIAEKVDEALAHLATTDNIKVRELVSSKIGSLVIEHVESLLFKVSSLRPIETAPKDGSYVLLFGLGGYTSTAWRCEVGQYDGRYKMPWRNHSNDSFTDGGEPPIYWMPLPSPVLFQA